MEDEEIETSVCQTLEHNGDEECGKSKYVSVSKGCSLLKKTEGEETPSEYARWRKKTREEPHVSFLFCFVKWINDNLLSNSDVCYRSFLLKFIVKVKKGFNFRVTLELLRFLFHFNPVPTFQNLFFRTLDELYLLIAKRKLNRVGCN